MLASLRARKGVLGRLPTLRATLLLVIPAVVAGLVLFFYLFSGRYVTTDNAYIGAQKVLITPEEVLIVNGYNETRHVYTDGRHHPPADDLWPSVTGNSVGHWDGDTLVIDTIMVTNPNAFFQGGPPLSEQAHYVERIWLDGNTLRAEITIEDPVTLTAPWKSRLSWVRDQGFDRMIQVDWNNDRTGTDGDVNTIEPPADERESQ